MKKIFSVDAETNGLWGQAFAIAAIVYNENGEEISRFTGRCPINEEINPWVSENVLPVMADIPTTCDSYNELLQQFVNFWMQNKEDATCLVHMGHIVEAKLWRDAHDMHLIGDWDAPYLWFDLCILPQVGDSVDTYAQKHNLSVPTVTGGTHNPLYDSIITAKVYFDIMQGK